MDTTVEQLEGFLASLGLQPKKDGPFIECRTQKLGDASMRSIFFDSTEKLLEMQWKEDRQIYFGPAMRRERGGLAVQCAEPPCFWLDIDPRQGAIDPSYANTVAAMLPCKPSIIVHSGRGLQMYWALDSVPSQWDERSRAWVLSCEAALAGLDVRVDRTFDRPRIMRLPGTVNQKSKSKATILLMNDLTYNGEDFPLYDSGQSSVEEIEGASREGTRNPRMWQILSALKWRGGLRGDTLRAAAHSTNETVCRPPLPKREIDGMVDRLEGPGAPQPITVAESASLVSTSDVAALCSERLAGEIMSVRSGGRTIWYSWSPELGVWREAPPHSAVYSWLLAARDQATDDPARRLFNDCMAFGNLNGIVALMGNSVNATTYLEDASLNRDDVVLPVENGYLQLQTSELLKPDPLMRFTTRASVAFDPDAQCPRWKSFLEQMIPDPAERRFLGLSFYYCMTGLNTSRAFFINLGSGRNGKTLAWSVWSDILGGFSGPGDQRVVTKGGGEAGHDAPVAALLHQRLAIYDELNGKDELNGAQVKRLTGGDRVRARAAYAPSYADIRMTCKHVLISNHRPRIEGEDLAVGDRLRYIQWRVRLNEGQVDYGLKDTLFRERSGILNWVLSHSEDFWRDPGLPMPATLAVEARNYLEEENEMLGFVRRHLRFTDVENPELSASGIELGAKWYDYTGERLVGRSWSGFYRDLIKAIELEGGKVSLAGSRVKKLIGVIVAGDAREELA